MALIVCQVAIRIEGVDLDALRHASQFRPLRCRQLCAEVTFCHDLKGLFCLKERGSHSMGQRQTVFALASPRAAEPQDSLAPRPAFWRIAEPRSSAAVQVEVVAPAAKR